MLIDKSKSPRSAADWAKRSLQFLASFDGSPVSGPNVHGLHQQRIGHAKVFVGVFLGGLLDSVAGATDQASALIMLSLMLESRQ